MSAREEPILRSVVQAHPGYFAISVAEGAGGRPAELVLTPIVAWRIEVMPLLPRERDHSVLTFPIMPGLDFGGDANEWVGPDRRVYDGLGGSYEGLDAYLKHVQDAHDRHSLLS